MEKQETGIGEFASQYNKIHDMAQKALDVKPWCTVKIMRRPKDKEPQELYRYDIPREMVWRYNWVLEWRKARFVCQYPRDRVELVFSFYDKTTGLEYEFQSLRSRQVAARALITKYINLKQKYLEERRRELFFNPSDDEILKKLDTKISSARKKFTELSQEVASTSQAIKPTIKSK